jgi:hypothetical protein
MTTLNTFPLFAPTGLPTGVKFYLDPKCQQAATVFTRSGSVTPGNTVALVDGILPLFQANATVLYYRDGQGNVDAVYPHPNATPSTVTGSKGANAALTSLMTTLAGLGIVVDGTS